MIRLALLSSLLSASLALAQQCPPARLGDGVCDCGCDPASDPDCPSGRFTVCERNNCPAGQVPWSDLPKLCMSSACGDGWADPVANEVCDDGDALASGGCAADCKSVNPGFQCGPRTVGCSPIPDAGSTVDAGSGSGGGSATSGAGGGGAAMRGCQSVDGASLGWLALLAWFGWRRSAR